MKKYLVLLCVITFLFGMFGVAGAKSVLFSSKNMFYYNINQPQTYHSYGGDPWSTMTSILDTATGNDVHVVSDFENLDQMLSYDALFINLRSRYIDPPISATELNNITIFINTGRRVVMVGENPFWASWNEIILSLAGGTLSSDTSVSMGATSYSIVNNELTYGVNSIYYGGSTAIGGTPLFCDNIATLWGDNILTVLTTNVFEKNNINNSDNKQFCTNIANWIAYNDMQAPVPATIYIYPDTLNLKSKGKLIRAYIELPEGYYVEDIDCPTILLEGEIGAESCDRSIESLVGDYDEDGILDYMVKFDRQAVIDHIEDIGIEDNDKVQLTVVGELDDGTPFEGSDTIRVIDKRKK